MYCDLLASVQEPESEFRLDQIPSLVRTTWYWCMQVDLLEKASLLSFEELPALYIHPSRTQQWLPELPREVGLSLLSCGRLASRLSLLIKEHYKLSPHPKWDDVDLAIAALNFTLLSRVPVLAGSIFHGRRLRTLISKAAITEYCASIDEHAHNLAVTHAELAPSHGDTGGGLPLPAKETIFRDGNLCFQAWLKSLPSPIAERVVLKFPDDFTSDSLPAEFESHGPGIVRAAGKGLLSRVQP